MQERLDRSTPGDYCVVEGGNMITVLAIRASEKNSILFEEVSVPSKNLKQRPGSWRQWIAERAPGHTSWSLIEIERGTGNVLGCYSFSRGGWLELSSQESFIATLIQIPLSPLPKEQRRKIGSPPPPGELDVRQLWAPPAIFNGKRQENVHFDVYEATWPKDGSELSGNRILLYFDSVSKFPLPYWIQIETSHAPVSLRTIDTGKHFPSPYQTAPKQLR